MLITSRQKRNNLHEGELSLKYNDIDIKMTTSDKILDVYVDEKLAWNNHYQHVSKKVSSYLWLLSKIKTIYHKSTGFCITLPISNLNLIIAV